MKVYVKSSTLGNEDISDVMMFWYEEREKTYHIRYRLLPEGENPIICEKIYPKWNVDKIEMEDTTHVAR